MNIATKIFVLWLFTKCVSLCDEVESGSDMSLAKQKDGNSDGPVDEVSSATAPKTARLGKKRISLSSAVQKATRSQEKKLLEQVKSLGDKTTTPDDIYLAEKLGQSPSPNKQPSPSMSDLKKKIKSFGKSIKTIKSDLKSELNISTTTNKKSRKPMKSSSAKNADTIDLDGDYKIDLWRPDGEENSKNRGCAKENTPCYVPLKNGIGLVFPCCSSRLKCDLDVTKCIKRTRDAGTGNPGEEKNLTALLPNFKKMHMKFKLQYD